MPFGLSTTTRAILPRPDGVTLHGWLLAWWAPRQRLNGPRAKDGRRTLLRARQGSRQLIASWELDVDDRRPFVRQPWRLPPGSQIARVLAQIAGDSRQVSKHIAAEAVMLRAVRDPEL